MSPGRRLLSLLLTHRTKIFIAIGCSLVTAASLLSFPFFVKELFEPRNGGSFVQDGLIGIGLLALLLVGASYAAYAAMFAVSRTVVLSLQTAYCGQLLRLPMEFHRGRSTGDLIDRLSRGIADIDWFLRYTLLTVIILVLIFAGGLGMLCALSLKLTGLLAAATVVAVLILRPLQRRARTAGESEQRRLAGLTDKIQELLSGIDVVKAFRREETETANFTSAARDSSQQGGLFAFIEPLIFALAIVLLLLLLLAGRALIAAGELDFPTLLAYLMYTLLLVPQARAVSVALVHWEQCATAFRRIDEILAIAPEPHSPAAEPEGALPRGIIRFESVSAVYPNREPALESVSFRLGEKEAVGIVGESGAGKSTLFQLLLRFTDYGGSIRIDGRELNDLTLDLTRRTFAIVPQDPFLFRATIAENIRYGNPGADEARMIEAARLAQADGFIGRLPQQYNTLVGERGASLAGGERQRIAIARALLTDAPVLLLDEATSALDAATEQGLQEALREVMRRRTLLIIAHRLATIVHLPRIIVLRRGRIVDEGSHEELLSRCEYYRMLASRQFASLSISPGARG